MKAPAQQQGIDQACKHHRRAEGHAVAKDRLEDREGHGVSRALQLPLFTEQQRQEGQHQSHPGVDRDGSQAEEPPAVIFLPQAHGHPVHQRHRRREPGNPDLSPIGKAVDQGAQDLVQAAFRHPGGKAQHRVHKRQDEKAPRQHGAEHRDAVKGQA